MKSVKFLFFVFTISIPIFAQSKIEIKNPWARPAAKGANSALFFVIENNGNKPDTLISAESKEADIVEVHETFKKENDMMGMREVKFVVIPAGSKIEFKPRSLHIMLLDMQKDLKIGGSLEVILNFKLSGKIKIKASVQDMPMQGMKH